MEKIRKRRKITIAIFCCVIIFGVFISLLCSKTVKLIPKDAVTVDMIIVYHWNNNWYCYEKERMNQKGDIVESDVLLLHEDDAEGCGALEIGDKVRIYCDGLKELMAPASFSNVYAVEIIGKAAEDELKEGVDYFNTEVAPWHLPH